MIPTHDGLDDRKGEISRGRTSLVGKTRVCEEKWSRGIFRARSGDGVRWPEFVLSRAMKVRVEFLVDRLNSYRRQNMISVRAESFGMRRCAHSDGINLVGEKDRPEAIQSTSTSAFTRELPHLP